MSLGAAFYCPESMLSAFGYGLLPEAQHIVFRNTAQPRLYLSLVPVQYIERKSFLVEGLDLLEGLEGLKSVS